MRNARACLVLALGLACAAVRAQDEATAPAPATTSSRFEAALGVVANHEPEYQGAARHRLSAEPAFFVRWGRVSISQASGFINRRRDEVPRGLGLEVVRRERVHFNLGLRIDRGRNSSVSEDLAGIEDVRSTLRLRASATWTFHPGWKLAGGWSMDALNRGGGQTADIGLTRERALGPRTTWAVGGSISAADGRYMRSYFGVAPAESQASGHPVYRPGAGLRDAAVGTTLRFEIDEHWSAYASVAFTRELGPAARSPLTTGGNQWAAGGGIARRF